MILALLSKGCIAVGALITLLQAEDSLGYPIRIVSAKGAL